MSDGQANNNDEFADKELEFFSKLSPIHQHGMLTLFCPTEKDKIERIQLIKSEMNPLVNQDDYHEDIVHKAQTHEKLRIDWLKTIKNTLKIRTILNMFFCYECTYQYKKVIAKLIERHIIRGDLKCNVFPWHDNKQLQGDERIMKSINNGRSFEMIYADLDEYNQGGAIIFIDDFRRWVNEYSKPVSPRGFVAYAKELKVILKIWESYLPAIDSTWVIKPTSRNTPIYDLFSRLLEIHQSGNKNKILHSADDLWKIAFSGDSRLRTLIQRTKINKEKLKRSTFIEGGSGEERCLKWFRKTFKEKFEKRGN